MPHITIQCPPLTRAQKADAVRRVTDAFSAATGHEAAIICVHIQEYPYQNIGVGGDLLADVLPAEHVASRNALLTDPE